jgi:hypothetical protein
LIDLNSSGPKKSRVALNICVTFDYPFPRKNFTYPAGLIFITQIFFMKRLLLFLSATVMMAFVANDPLSEKERNYAVTSLTETRDQLFEAIKGLSEAQLKFKPAPDRWSVEDCLKHIAFTEGRLWDLCEGTLKQTANPEKRTEIKMTDEELLKRIEDRSNKVKTRPEMEPQNISYKTADEAIAVFKERREKLINFVKTTNEDMRNHVAQMPFGMLDAYQVVIFISGHSNRHTQQINEVKADPNFPKQ